MRYNRIMKKQKKQKKRVSKDALFRRLVRVVALKGMPYSEYVLQCASNGVDASFDDPAYFGWLLRGCQDGDCGDFEKAQDMLVEAVELKYAGFDWSSDEAVEHLMDPLVEAAMHGYRLKDFAERLWTAVMKSYAGTEVADRLKRLNRGFGITTYGYFGC